MATNGSAAEQMPSSSLNGDSNGAAPAPATAQAAAKSEPETTAVKSGESVKSVKSVKSVVGIQPPTTSSSYNVQKAAAARLTVGEKLSVVYILAAVCELLILLSAPVYLPTYLLHPSLLPLNLLVSYCDTSITIILLDTVFPISYTHTIPVPSSSSSSSSPLKSAPPTPSLTYLTSHVSKS